ncbi:hypothetical protein M5K25_026753 [Dendrobium thyrsiflorum]|uniref:Uncharacterized protein n=1 Tax=Dendrobium thyrsiflorum TaxID=117978 RepID=A0ABD0TY14_DENTH
MSEPPIRSKGKVVRRCEVEQLRRSRRPTSTERGWTATKKRSESAIVVSGDSSVDSESPPRFTCFICDAMSGSDSSSSGKYRSSSELQSIGCEELAWLGHCLEEDAGTLDNPFRLSTGSLSQAQRCWLYFVELAGEWHCEFRDHPQEYPVLPRLEAFGDLEDQLVNDGIPWRILRGVDRHNGCRHESSFGPISDDLDCWGRISGKPHRMSRPYFPFFLHFLLHLYEVLASRSVFLFAETFRRWIPEPDIQVSHPDVHRTRLFVFFYFFPMVGMISSEPGRLWLIRIQAPFSSEGLGLQAVGPRKISSTHQRSYFFLPILDRNGGSSCSNCWEVDTTKLDGSSGISSFNNSICQLNPGSLSQLDCHWGVL